MIGEKAVGLVPPRPNLGPEPWRDPSPDRRLVWASALLAAGVLLAAWWARRHRRVSRGDGSGPAADDPGSADPGPRGRLLALSAGIRDALSTELGTSFRARTTEELADDDRLAGLLGEEAFRELLQFLDVIDRIKFALERADDDRSAELGRALSAWEPAIAAITARVRSRPRPRSRPGAGPDRPRT